MGGQPWPAFGGCGRLPGTGANRHCNTSGRERTECERWHSHNPDVRDPNVGTASTATPPVTYTGSAARACSWLPALQLE